CGGLGQKHRRGRGIRSIRYQTQRALGGRAMTARRFAFIDIGTNSILCLIADLKIDGSSDGLDDLAEITRLGQGVHQTGRISPEGEERSLKVLQRYLERCKRLT